MAEYRVQSGDDVDTYDEEKLRKKLRSNDLSGLELVKREGDEGWTPLCETELFRDEVPFRGNPIDAARRREVQGFVGHLSGWAITAGIMGALGSWFPFWLLIWGVFLVFHGVKVMPSALALMRAGKLFGSALAGAPATGRRIANDEKEATSPLADEVARVRALLQKHGGEHAARLADQIDQLVATLQESARRRADLQSQLSPDELRELDRAREEADRRLRIATNDQDRSLLRQELEAVDQRQDAVAHAQRTIERLESRERVAKHQLKQLRLDLSQAQARIVDVPDLAERLEDIRLEAEAIEEVEEALAESQRSQMRR